MNKVGRTLTLIGTALGVLAAVILLSRIVLTIDDLQSTGLRIGYAVAVSATVVAAYLFIRSRLRGPGASRRATLSHRAPPHARLHDLFTKHGLDDHKGDAALARRVAQRSGQGITIALCGLPTTGKSCLAQSLNRILTAHLPLQGLQIIEADVVAGDLAANLDELGRVLAADIVVFVSDQDLRDYEFAVIKALTQRGASPLIVLNKADLRSAEARRETLAAVKRRLDGLVVAEDIVEAAADPLPVVCVARQASGEDVEREMQRPADVAALSARIISRLKARAGRSLSV